MAQVCDCAIETLKTFHAHIYIKWEHVVIHTHRQHCVHSYLHSVIWRLQLTIHNNPAQTGHCQQLCSPGTIVILHTWGQGVHVAGLLHSVEYGERRRGVEGSYMQWEQYGLYHYTAGWSAQDISCYLLAHWSIACNRLIGNIHRHLHYFTPVLEPLTPPHPTPHYAYTGLLMGVGVGAG